MAKKKTTDKQSFPCGRPSPSTSVSHIEKSEALAKLQAFELANNLNQSDARTKILETILQGDTHFRVKELVKKIQVRNPNISQSTVYRNIGIFVQSGLIHEGPVDFEGQARYELSKGKHHNHIICSDCHQIVEFQDSKLDQRLNEISEKMGFIVENHQNTIYSRCKFLATSKAKSKIAPAWIMIAGGAIAASMAVAVNSTALDFMNSSRESRLKSAETAMLQSCRQEFSGIVAGKSLNEVDHWAEAQENAEPVISTEFKKTQCYSIHEAWERIAQRNEWAITVLPVPKSSSKPRSG